MGREPESVGGEGVALQNVRPGGEILGVDVPHQAWPAQVQLFEGQIDEDALGVKHGSHGAIEQSDTAARQEFTKRLLAWPNGPSLGSAG